VQIDKRALDGALRIVTAAPVEVFDELTQHDRLLEAVNAARANGQGGASLVDIEDLVGNATANRALPLCVLNLIERPTYPNHFERLWLSQTLASFKAPALHTTAIARSLMRRSTPTMIQEHFKELCGFSESTLEKGHQNAAMFVARKKNSVGELTPEEASEALAKTTCAKSCSTNYQFGDMTGLRRCPFSWSGDPQRLDALLLRSGVADAEERTRIIEMGGGKPQCMAQLKASRLPPPNGMEAVPVLRTETEDIVIDHPFHYFHLAADHLQRSRAIH
jgi:hypothetical protein